MILINQTKVLQWKIRRSSDYKGEYNRICWIFLSDTVKDGLRFFKYRITFKVSGRSIIINLPSLDLHSDVSYAQEIKNFIDKNTIKIPNDQS